MITGSITGKDMDGNTDFYEGKMITQRKKYIKVHL